MIEKNTTWNILDLFFENPTTHFHLRELSRLARLSMPSIISVTDTLSKNDLIIKTKGKVLTSVIANLISEIQKVT